MKIVLRRPALCWEAKQLIWSPDPGVSITLYSAFHSGATSQQVLLKAAHTWLSTEGKFTLASPTVYTQGYVCEEIFLERWASAEFRKPLPLPLFTSWIHDALLAKPSLIPKELAGGGPLKEVALQLGVRCPILWTVTD